MDTTDKKTILCPDCKDEDKGQIIAPDDVEVGEILECPNCAAEVEVVSIDPLEVRLIIEEK